ncbi:MAG: dihydroorotate dehydrogenase-like protein [Deltaproteobacteria bacterium]|nr:MAG: dihydroorotate dehydrogenase-like protein [Deltaproteobacteria bacterium]
MDITTNYLGLTLKHPLVPSPSPLSYNLDGIRRLEDAGAPAVVMFSLFEEEVQNTSLHFSHALDYGSASTAEASNFFPDIVDFVPPVDRYLQLVSDARSAIDVPLIASLNCTALGQWLEYAALIEAAGANALELNLYDLPTDPYTDGISLESRYVEIVEEVKKQVSIPVAVKLHPFFTSLPNVAHQLANQGGADGLVLFNRFYQPDIDIDAFEVTPGLRLSDSSELRLPLRWTAILYGKVPVDLAITTGIHTHVDLLKAMMVGANIGMVASELLKHGLGRINEIVEDLKIWMEAHEYESVQQMRGSMSYQHIGDPSHFVRANYIQTLGSFRFDPTGQDF